MTLLEDLETAAALLDEEGFVARSRALREHAKRLREEMDAADKASQETWRNNYRDADLRLLERINGGSPTEGTEAGKR